MKKDLNKAPKRGFIEKTKTYYSYNKYKMPILFALIGVILLTAFPGLHYEYWYEVPAKAGDYNAVAVFLLMLLALVQFVNVINISAKKSKKSEITYLVIFTVINLIMIYLAYVYISAYFVNGFQSKYLNSVLVIISGIVFMLIANVLGFIFLKYDTKSSIKELLASLENEEENEEVVIENE